MCQLESGAQLHEPREARSERTATPTPQLKLPFHTAVVTPPPNANKDYTNHKTTTGGADGERVKRARSEKHEKNASRQRGGASKKL